MPTQRSRNLFSVSIFLVMGLLGLGALERFFRIGEIGLYGSDTFFYWETARDWLNGKIELTPHYRPLAYLFYTLAMKVGGVNDYSIKYFNVILDMFTMGVILCLGRAIRLPMWMSVLALAFYVSCPQIVIQARSELLHVPSTFFFLLSLTFLGWTLTRLREQNSLSQWSLFLSGLFFGAAMHVHPSLINVAPAYLGILSWLAFFGLRDSEMQKVSWTNLAGVWSLGFSMPFLLVIGLFGFEKFWVSFMAGSKAQSGGALPLVERFGLAAQSFFQINTSWVYRWFFWICSGGFAISLFLKKRWPNWLIAFVVFGWAYIFFYCLLTPKYLLERTYIPILIPGFYFCLFVFDSLLKKVAGPQVSKILTVSLVLVVCSMNRWVSGDLRLIPWSQRPSIYREIQNFMSDSVSGRMLVMNLLAYADREPLAHPALFGSQAVYLLHTEESSLEEVISNQNIQYALFLREELDERIRREEEFGRKFFLERLKTLYSKEENLYSAAWEESEGQSLLMKNGWKSIYKSERFAVFQKTQKESL